MTPQAITDDVLQDFLAGRLEPPRQSEISAALAGDPALARRLQRLQDAYETLALISSHDVPVPAEWLILLRREVPVGA